MNKLRIFSATRWNLALAFAGLLALCPNDVGANTVALTISTSNRGEDASVDVTVGWQFTVNNAILVTDLGVWDGFRRFGGAGDGETPAGGGLGESHTVTIWDANGNALAQATVPAGMAGTLVDVFRYVSLPSPVSLQPGTYTIGAYYAGNSATPDGAAFFADPINTAPEISYDASTYTFGNGSPMPGDFSDASGYFGPNFQFQNAADTTPPTITSVTATPNSLWPPNHKLIPVTISVSAFDDSGQTPSSKVIDVSCNEVVADSDIVITGDLTLKLRATRSGNGKTARLYTITVRCTDAAGNFSDATVQVTVPHDKGKNK
jgi:Domain of unknown function (DUF4082)